MAEQLPQLTVSSNDKVEVEIIFADNQLVILSNGAEVHSTKSDRAGGRLNAKIDLNSSLTPGKNYVTFIGIAWGPRLQFNYRTLVNGQSISSHSDDTGQCPAGKGKAYLKSFDIIVSD